MFLGPGRSLTARRDGYPTRLRRPLGRRPVSPVADQRQASPCGRGEAPVGIVRLPVQRLQNVLVPSAVIPVV